MHTNKSVLVLIHGHGVDASIWNGIYADFAPGLTILSPDFSRLTNHSTVEAYADDLYAQLQSAQLEKVMLVGHSMGGYVALAFADQHPEMIQGLVLFHSTALADDDDRRQTRQQAIEALKAGGTAPFIQKQMPKMVAPNYSSGKTQALIDRFGNLPADALIAGMTAMLNRPDRTHVLHNAQYPVLLVLGRNDQVIPYEKAVKLADLSSRINVATIEQAGHLGMIEQPEASIDILQPFVGQL